MFRTLREWFFRLWGTWKAHDAGWEEELRLHLEMAEQDALRLGNSPREARLRAGGLAQASESVRDQNTLRWLGDLSRDVRYGARVLRKSPLFTAAAIGSLALGIGANTAIFSVIDALLLRNLPVQHPEELVMLTKTWPNNVWNSFLFRDLERYRALKQSFYDVLAVTPVERTGIKLDTAGGSIGDDAQVCIGLVSGNYFSTLGVSASLGRTLTADDDTGNGGHPVAVISHGYWQRMFAQDPGVVGRTFTLTRTKYTILGVAPKEFTGDWVGRPYDMWIPVAMVYQVRPELPASGERGSRLSYRFIARLRPGVANAQAQAAAEVLFDQILKETPGSESDAKMTMRLDPIARGYSPQREFFTQALAILMAMVGAVLLLACANVANLLLARATARRREIAVRLAVGAGRARIVRQLLVESLLLAMAGGALGLLFAIWGANALAGLVRGVHDRGFWSIDLTTRLDARILAFDIVLCLLTGIVFGLAPAWRGSKVPLSPALAMRGADSGSVVGKLKLRNLLVVLQVTVTVMLLAGMGLFLRSLHNLRSEGLGIDRDRLLLVWTVPGQAGRSPASLASFFQTVQEGISALPGVVSASPSVYGIMSFSGDDGPPVAADGHRFRPNEGPRAYFHIVGPRFFDTTGIKLLDGRDFTERDDAAAPRVAIINKTMAQHFFGNSSPLGRHVWANYGNNPPLEVIGVVADAKSFSPRESRHMSFYTPVRQQNSLRLLSMCMVVRTAGLPAAVATGVRAELRRIEPQLPVWKIDTVDQQLDDILFQDRLLASLSLCFGMAAILLACVGLYGVMSYTVAQRTNEIGIRVALGAHRPHVLGMVLRESVVLALAGILFGVPAALAAARVVENRLFRVGPGDPMTIGAAALLVIVVAAVAGMEPALQASRVDPIEALKYE
jgi:predicted permease